MKFGISLVSYERIKHALTTGQRGRSPACDTNCAGRLGCPGIKKQSRVWRDCREHRRVVSTARSHLKHDMYTTSIRIYRVAFYGLVQDGHSEKTQVPIGSKQWTTGYTEDQPINGPINMEIHSYIRPLRTIYASVQWTATACIVPLLI
jgi:hypothetical protein